MSLYCELVGAGHFESRRSLGVSLSTPVRDGREAAIGAVSQGVFCYL